VCSRRPYCRTSRNPLWSISPPFVQFIPSQRSPAPSILIVITLNPKGGFSGLLAYYVTIIIYLAQHRVGAIKQALELWPSLSRDYVDGLTSLCHSANRAVEILTETVYASPLPSFPRGRERKGGGGGRGFCKRYQNPEWYSIRYACSIDCCAGIGYGMVW